MFYGNNGSTVLGEAISGGRTNGIAQKMTEKCPQGVQNLHAFCFFNELVKNGDFVGGHSVNFEDSWTRLLNLMRSLSPRPSLVAGAGEATWKYSASGYDNFAGHVVRRANCGTGLLRESTG